MKKYLLSCFISSILLLSAQEIAPRLSPRSQTISHVGYTEIIIDYGSPGVKGRKIFGDLETYNVMWRAGANEATTFSFSTDVYINGNFIPKGKYSFFIIPEVTDQWTIIFNKDFNLNGIEGYKKENDMLRITIKPEFTKESRERLIYDIQSDGIKEATVMLYWSFLKLPFIIKVNFEEETEDRLKELLAKTEITQKWKVYYDLVDFYFRANLFNPKEYQWITQAEELLNYSDPKKKENNLSMVLWAKARVLVKNEKTAQAKLLYNQIIKMNTDFVNKNKNILQNTMARWEP